MAGEAKRIGGERATTSDLAATFSALHGHLVEATTATALALVEFRGVELGLGALLGVEDLLLEAGLEMLD